MFRKLFKRMVYEITLSLVCMVADWLELVGNWYPEGFKDFENA